MAAKPRRKGGGAAGKARRAQAKSSAAWSSWLARPWRMRGRCAGSARPSIAGILTPSCRRSSGGRPGPAARSGRPGASSVSASTGSAGGASLISRSSAVRTRRARSRISMASFHGSMPQGLGLRRTPRRGRRRGRRRLRRALRLLGVPLAPLEDRAQGGVELRARNVVHAAVLLVALGLADQPVQEARVALVEEQSGDLGEEEAGQGEEEGE